MSKRAPSRSVRSSSRAGSVKSSSKGPAGKKPETCAACSKPNKNLRLLDCSHALCPGCLKSSVKEPETKDDKPSKMSQKGGNKKGAAGNEEIIVCHVCDKLPTPQEASEHGQCDPCEFVTKPDSAELRRSHKNQLCTLHHNLLVQITLLLYHVFNDAINRSQF